jgi:4-hydroxy-2-oxoheptanedioate aldolase
VSGSPAPLQARHGLAAQLKALTTDPAQPVATMGWCTLGGSFAAETVGRSGVDVVCIDLEHGMSGWDGALPTVVTLSAAQIPVVVRVSSHEPIGMMKALDAGADGVVVPHVQTADDAAAAVAACLYPPAGQRSWGPTRTSLLTDADTGEVNESVVCVAMLESVEAISNARLIAGTPSLGGVLVGSNDLSLDMCSSDRSRSSARASQDFQDLLTTAVAACQEAGVVCAAPAATHEEAQMLREIGVRLIVLPSDAALLRDVVRKEAVDLRGGDVEELSFVSVHGRSLRY